MQGEEEEEEELFCFLLVGFSTTHNNKVSFFKALSCTTRSLNFTL
jgi:hypothetical protein